LTATASGDAEALRRFYEHLDPGGTLVLDNENPYSSAYPWRYWRKDERSALPRAREPLEWVERRRGSDGAEYALQSRLVDHREEPPTGDDDFIVFVAGKP
jgi:hypothetical protein